MPTIDTVSEGGPASQPARSAAFRSNLARSNALSPVSTDTVHDLVWTDEEELSTHVITWTDEP